MNNYLAFYRKYRPKTFDEICGQEFIKETLKNIVKNNKISHSYMFTGPRGTGKTSTAKIFAKTINCEQKNNGISCEKCENCKTSNINENIDIIEMDAASNNGVDEIREIKNHVTLMPNNSKYKIYIIDEVHMLSNGAFNALLKTLEEPPRHIIFILATTDPQKVPLTIKSRCQIFEFKPIPKISIIEKLKFIATKEKIKVDEKSLDMIADSSNGGLRDAISLLDQLNSYTNGNITFEKVIELNGNITEEEIQKLFNLIIKQDYEKCFNLIDEFQNSGKNLTFLAENIIEYLKREVINKNNFINYSSEKIIEIILSFNDCIKEMKNNSDKRVYFDVCLLKCFKILNNQTNVCDNNLEKLNTITKEKKEKASKVEKNLKTNMETKTNIEEKSKDYKNYYDLMEIRLNNILLNADKNSLEKYNKLFNELKTNITNLEDLKLANLLSESIIRAGSVDGIVLTINDKNILEELFENLFKIENLFHKMLGNDIKVCIILNQKWLNERTKYVEKIKKKELKYEDETDIIQSITNSLSKKENEFESLLEIGE